MKRRQKLGWFTAGILVALLTAMLLSPAMAAMVGKTITVYTGIQVYVNDAKLEPKDVNGNPVDVFVYNGTTYLPIRAIGTALGMDVDYDAATQSAYVGKRGGETAGPEDKEHSSSGETLNDTGMLTGALARPRTKGPVW